MPTLLTDRTFSFDHLPLGSGAEPGDGVTKPGTWLKAAPDTSEVIPSRTRPGRRACRMVHKPGSSPFGAGYRIQANAWPWGEQTGTEAWYAAAFLLPAGFTPLATWGIPLQLHHAANTGSPPIAVRVDRWWDPTPATPGSLYIAGRDQAGGTERAWSLLPEAPIDVAVRLILHAVWGGEPGTGTPGRLEAWTHTGPPGASAPGDLAAWRQHHPAGGWTDTTIFPGDTRSYWALGFYTGSPSQAVTIEHDGLVRRQTAAGCLEWMAATTTTPPPPPPPPSVPADAVRDLEAVAAQIAETARDMQAAGLMVGTVIERLRAGGGSGA